jgi:hypothetical protein
MRTKWASKSSSKRWYLSATFVTGSALNLPLAIGISNVLLL